MGDRASRGGRGVRVGRSGRENWGVRGGSGCRVGWVLGRNLGNWNNLLIFLDIGGGIRGSRGGREVRVGRSGRECRGGWVLGRNLENWNNLLIFLDIFSVLHSNSAIKMQWVNIILIKNTETTLEVMRS